jgi:hypothetical protein
MDLGSTEGLLLTLLFIVPGGLGMQFRRYIYPASQPSAFSELLHSVATSVSALVLLEFVTGVVGFIRTCDFLMGGYLTNDLLQGKDHLIAEGSQVWVRYLGLAIVAVTLPPVLGRIRNTQPIRKLFGGIGRFDEGFDDLFEERWSGSKRDAAPWVVVETTDNRRLQGQVVWRSTAPNEPELTLSSVWDVTDSKNQVALGVGHLWVPAQTIRRVLLHPADAPRAK